MKVVFISNYYNHHQSSLSKELYRLTDGEYFFIETEEMEAERKSLGWDSKNKEKFIMQSYTNDDTYQKSIQLINEADFVIFGSAPYTMIRERLKRDKLVFFYSERIYKKGLNKWSIPLRFIKYYLEIGKFKNAYLLCASAFVASDYSKTRTFINKTYKWGYFPPFVEYNIDQLLQNKENEILWCGRFIDWKHPEVPIEIAEKLINDGYSCKVNMIGTGPMRGVIEDMIKAKKLDKYVIIHDSMSPNDVRKYMEKSKLFLFTSDFNEGWGAVLNESMNSGCAVIASHAIGAVPFLIKDGINGYIYKNGDSEELYKKLKSVLDSKDLTYRLGKEGYTTIKNNWNAKVAAERIISLSDNILNGDRVPAYSEGICSKAEILDNDWFI